jgi:hypothetical protein
VQWRLPEWGHQHPCRNNRAGSRLALLDGAKALWKLVLARKDAKRQNTSATSVYVNDRNHIDILPFTWMLPISAFDGIVPLPRTAPIFRGMANAGAGLKRECL